MEEVNLNEINYDTIWLVFILLIIYSYTENNNWLRMHDESENQLNSVI